MAYELRDVPVIQIPGTCNKLVVHMCNAGGEDLVEFLVGGQTVVLRREDFAQMSKWVDQQFAVLSTEKRLVH